MNRFSNPITARARWFRASQATRCDKPARTTSGVAPLRPLAARPSCQRAAPRRGISFAIFAAQFSLGRVLLHLLVLLRYRRHVHWHFQCICREFYAPRN